MAEVVGGSPIRLVAALQAICDHWSTREQSGQLGRSTELVKGGQWYTLGEAVDRLAEEPHSVPLSYSTVRRMAERGEIPTTRVGSRRDRWIPVEALEALKARLWSEAHPEHEAGPAPEPEQDQQEP